MRIVDHWMNTIVAEIVDQFQCFGIPDIRNIFFECDATEPGNGTISSTVVLTAPAGMVWTIDQAIDYYTDASNSGNLIPIPQGTIMDENNTGGSESEYSYTGIFVC